MVIPEGWESAELGEICTKIGSGKTPHGGESVYTIAGIMLIRSQNVDNGKMLLADVAYIDDEINSTMSNTELQKNDVLLNITGASIGRCCTYGLDARANVNQHVCIIRLKKGINHRLVMYQLLSIYGQRQIEAFQTGAKQGLNFQQIGKLHMILPRDNIEQNDIATVLSDMDGLIVSLEKLLAKKQSIKQGTMQELLTGKKRLAGFSEEWQVCKLGEIADIKDGTHQTPHYVDDGIPFYSVENVSSNDFQHTKFITESEYKKLTASYHIEYGDVLMTRIGSIGVCKYVNWNAKSAFYVSLALLKFKDKDLALYMSFLSKTMRFKKQVEIHSLQFAVPMKINLGKIGLFWHPCG